MAVRRYGDRISSWRRRGQRTFYVILPEAPASLVQGHRMVSEDGENTKRTNYFLYYPTKLVLVPALACGSSYMRGWGLREGGERVLVIQLIRRRHTWCFS